MYDLVRNLISNPLTAFVAVLITWGLLYLFLIRIGKLKQVTWVKLEYIWIGIGFLGLLSIIDENRQKFKIVDLERIETWIENDYETLLSFLDNSAFHCMKYNSTGLFSQERFNQIQARTDSVCAWSKQVSAILDSTYSNGKLEIKNLPRLEIINPESEYSYERITQLVNTINPNVKKRDKLIAEIGNQFWQDFKYGFGIILLILAFGIRFTIISQKVRNEKKEKSTIYLKKPQPK